MLLIDASQGQTVRLTERLESGLGSLRQAGEVAGVGDVGGSARARAVVPGGSIALRTVSLRAVSTTTATVSTVSTTRSATSAAATATTGCATTLTALTALTTSLLLLPAEVDVNDVLGLALTLTLGLAASAGNKVLLLTSEGLALWEVLAGTLVRLAGLEGSTTKSGLLLELLSKVLLVGLGVVLLDLDGLTLGVNGSGGVGNNALLLLFGVGIG